MSRFTVLLGLCVLLSSSAAHADKKNPTKAKIMSGVAAAVSGSVVLTGFMLQKDGDPFNAPVLYTGLGLLAITPSIGEFYSGQYLTIGMGVRAAAAGFAIYVVNNYTRLAKCPLAPPSDPPECDIFTEGAYPLLGVAAIGFIGGVWYDVLDAGDAAERYNRKHGFSVTPTVMPAPQGPTPGMMFSGTF
jgi:hypothetical protein